MSKKDAWKGAAIGAGVGILAGAIAGILFAPKSGKETREDIKKYLHEMKDEIAKKLEKVGVVSREKYTEISSQVVAGYVEAKKIPAAEAAEIKKDLIEGYDQVKKAMAKAKAKK